MTSILNKEETQEFISKYYSGSSNARFEQMLQECKRSVIQSIVVPFGLGKVVAAYDKVGGNVDTIHNVRKSVYATDEAKEGYRKHREEGYHHDDFHQEKGSYGEMREQAQSIKSGTAIGIDAYTGLEMNVESISVTLVGKNGGVYRPNSPSRDHIIAAHTIWGDAGVYLAEIDPDILINMSENLVLTTNYINSVKSDLSVPDFLDIIPEKISAIQIEISRLELKLHSEVSYETRTKLENDIQKGKEHLSQLEEIKKNKNQIQKDYDKVNSLTESKINEAYYTSKKFIVNTAQTSAVEGVKVGTQQVVGLVMVEFFIALFEEISDMYHKGFFVEQKDVFETLKIRLQNIAVKVKRYITERYKDLVMVFGGGFITGILSNLVTVAINIFATTSTRFVRIVREGIFSFLRAVQLILFRPEYLSQEEAWYEAKKLVVSGLIVGLGVVIEQSVEAFLTSLGLGGFASVLTSVFIGALTGICIAVAMYWLDTHRGSVEKMRYEAIKQLCYENLPELVSERENLTRLIEATHGQRLISLESSFADYQQMNIDCDDKGIYEALAKVNALWKKELLIKTDEDMQVALNQGSGALYFDEQVKNNAANNPILPQT